MTAGYTYNGSGQRAKKNVNGTVTIFHYNQNGQPIAESDSAGTITAEYVYLNGQPLAKVEGTNTYYYHNDHLATPQKMTDASGTVVWAADYKPFGEATITISTITNNLRFPGQYFDAETGMHYNYFRDYNPATGRYPQADPIGLRGGFNPYRYAKNNPLFWSDPLGLTPPANIPPSVNMQQNIQDASNMSTLDFYNAVKGGGPWDYKKDAKYVNGKNPYEDFGNYNYGVTGSAAGFSEETLLQMAGAYQIYKGTSQPGWGWPWTGPPYGDQPEDQDWIKEGIKDYNSGYYKIKPGICH